MIKDNFWWSITSAWKWNNLIIGATSTMEPWGKIIKWGFNEGSFPLCLKTVSTETGKKIAENAQSEFTELVKISGNDQFLPTIMLKLAAYMSDWAAYEKLSDKLLNKWHSDVFRYKKYCIVFVWFINYYPSTATFYLRYEQYRQWWSWRKSLARMLSQDYYVGTNNP